MVQGLNPRATGLVKHLTFDNPNTDERYQMVAMNSHKTYAIKPQYFNKSDLSDLIAIYGDIDTSLKINNVSVKGQLYSDDMIIQKQAPLMPMSLDVNYLTREDPLIYAKQIREYDKKKNTDYIVEQPYIDWNPGKLDYTIKINGQSTAWFAADYAPAKPIVFEYDLVSSLPDLFINTNKDISLSMEGGASLSFPTSYLKQYPKLTITATPTTASGFYYEAKVGAYTAAGWFQKNYSHKVLHTAAASYFIQNGIQDNEMFGIGIIQNIITLVNAIGSGSAMSGLSGVVDFILKVINPEIAYANRKNSAAITGGDIIGSSVYIEDDTSALERVIGYFLKVSYPIKNFMPFTTRTGAVANVYPSDYEANKVMSFAVNAKFEDYNAFNKWVQTNIGDVQLVGFDGGPVVDYGSYSEMYNQMIGRGILL